MKEKHLTIGKLLGRGSFGEVYECNLTSNASMKFAIKFSKSKEHDAFKIIDYFGNTLINTESKEASLMDFLVNINVVQRYGLVLLICLYQA